LACFDDKNIEQFAKEQSNNFKDKKQAEEFISTVGRCFVAEMVLHEKFGKYIAQDLTIEANNVLDDKVDTTPRILPIDSMQKMIKFLEEHVSKSENENYSPSLSVSGFKDREFLGILDEVIKKLTNEFSPVDKKEIKPK
jgi:hypothetical protein